MAQELSRVKRMSVILSEAEKDCAAHSLLVNVVHTPALPKPNRQPKIIAGLLRIIAENTDGRCAFRGATDSKLQSTGMVFRFTTDVKRDEFIKRIKLYLDPVVQLQLSVAKI